MKKLVALKYFKTKLQDVNGETYHEDNIFDLDDSGEPIDVSGNKVQYRTETGFIAQEVEKIPELNYLVTPTETTTSDIYEMVKDASGIEQRTVTGTKSLDHPYSLNYNDLFVMNIQATQELDKRIIYLEQQLALEKIKNSTQEIVLSDVLARLDALEQP